MQTRSAADDEVFDFVIIGSGFGGSVAAMRLAEKGYRVLILERGKHYRDQDFQRHSRDLGRSMWLPALRCFGLLEPRILGNMVIFQWSGVGGGSLGYGAVLLEPDDRFFQAPVWRDLADWKNLLRPHYITARRMLGAAPNPRLSEVDAAMQAIAADTGRSAGFRVPDLGICFEAVEQGSDPYFDGAGPPRHPCIYCGSCLLGCHHNAKNSLPKNYLYFAAKWGAQIRPEALVSDVRPLPVDQPDRARYEVLYHSSTSWPRRPIRRVRARNVVVAAGVVGSLELLLRCRDITRSLPNLSPRLGEMVRTNNEALVAATSRNPNADFSGSVAFSSLFHADDVTCIEVTRPPASLSLLRFATMPMIDASQRALARLRATARAFACQWRDALRLYLWPNWSRRTILFLVMQGADNHVRVGLRRRMTSLFRPTLTTMQTSDAPEIPATIPLGHTVARSFARRTAGVPAELITEGLLGMPATGHPLGGCLFGRTAGDGVIDLNCQVFHYPGLYVVDGSIVTANPGVNPALTITALAEYAMSRIPPNQADRPQPHSETR